MTSSRSTPHVRPPQEACRFDQRLEAANEAWAQLIHAQHRPDGETCVSRDMTMLSSFSRFLHELIPDHKLRGEILHSFASQQSADTVVGNGTIQ